MDVSEMILAGLFAPVILFFLLGIVTVFVKSDVEIPPAMSRAMAIFLMASIGLEGGAEAVEALGVAPGLLRVIVAVAVVAMILGVFFAICTGNILKRLARLKTADAWAAGGHYAAVSSATLAVGIGIASAAQEAFPAEFIFAGWMAAIYPFMDSPALITAIIFGRMALAKEVGGVGTKIETKKILHGSVFGMAVWLLVCSLIIGMVAQQFSPTEMERTLVFFDGMFRGVLCLFMLDMGMVAARQLRALKEMRRNLWKAVLCAFGIPQIWGLVGIFSMYAVHLLMPGRLGWGDAFVFATIAGGASFITAPAAMRIAMPEANPSVYLPMSVALTFPFNLIIGMPMWQWVTMALWGVA